MNRQDMEDRRVTREEAAVHACVSMRTISRWSALGLLDVRRPESGSPKPATYSLKRVMQVAQRARRIVTLELPD